MESYKRREHPLSRKSHKTVDHSLSVKTVICLFMVGFCFGCVKGDATVSSKGKPTIVFEKRVSTVSDYESVKGKIVRTDKHGWITSKIKVDDQVVVSHISFIDENVGWACGNKNFYKTRDAGDTWTKLESNNPCDAKTERLYFVNNVDGWIVRQVSNSEYKYSEDDRVEVFRTVDGGKIWKLSTSILSVNFKDALFTDDWVWLIGEKFLGYSPLRLRPLLFAFSEKDGWRDIYSKLIDNEDGFKNRFLSLEKIARFGKTCVAIITNNKNLLKKCDSSEDWQYVTGYENEEMYSMSVKMVGFNDENNVWVIESSGGVEGTASRLTVFDMATSKAKFSDLGNFYANYGHRLGNEKYVVAGTKMNYTLNSQDDKFDLNKESIVLVTKNDGVTWQQVFRSSTNEEFIGHSFVNGRVFWILGKDGVIYRFSRQNE